MLRYARMGESGALTLATVQKALSGDFRLYQSPQRSFTGPAIRCDYALEPKANLQNKDFLKVERNPLWEHANLYGVQWQLSARGSMRARRPETSKENSRFRLL